MLFFASVFSSMSLFYPGDNAGTLILQLMPTEPGSAQITLTLLDRLIITSLFTLPVLIRVCFANMIASAGASAAFSFDVFITDQRGPSFPSCFLSFVFRVSADDFSFFVLCKREGSLCVFEWGAWSECNGMGAQRRTQVALLWLRIFFFF